MACTIVGGGVAGAALAFLLAREGSAVELIDRGNGPWSGPWETVLPSARALLERSGLAAVVADCAQQDPLRHGAIWGSEQCRWQQQAAPGLLLRRGAFDAALRDAAAAAGARVRCGERTTPAAPGERLVVATGRTVRVAKPGATTASGPGTLAFAFRGGLPPADCGTAVVEAVPQGWIWTHALATGLASATVVVDAGQLRKEGRERLLGAAFAAARGPASRLVDRRLHGVVDATPRLHSVAGELRLGDAAAAIDPLASQGVEKALAAADHAAAVLRSAAARPDWWPRLVACHARWERGLWQAHAAAAAAWYRREERFATEPFWRRRRQAASLPASTGRLHVAEAVRAGPVLVREGAVFVERAGFRHDGIDDERTHVGHLPLAPLLALFARPRTIDEAVALAGSDPRLFALGPAAVQAALQELARSGWLVDADAANGQERVAPADQ